MELFLSRRRLNIAHGNIHLHVQEMDQGSSLPLRVDSESNGLDLVDGLLGENVNDGFRDDGFLGENFNDGFESDGAMECSLDEDNDEGEDSQRDSNEERRPDESESDDDASHESISVASTDDSEFDYRGCESIPLSGEDH